MRGIRFLAKELLFHLLALQEPENVFVWRTRHRVRNREELLGSLLLSLVISKLTRLMTSKLNLWYLDDVTFSGSPATVLKDCQNVIDGAAEAEVELNPGRFELFIFGGVVEEQQQTFADFHE